MYQVVELLQVSAEHVHEVIGLPRQCPDANDLLLIVEKFVK